MDFVIPDQIERPLWAKDTSAESVKVKFGASDAYQILKPDLVAKYDKLLSDLWNHQSEGFPGSLAISILRNDFTKVISQDYVMLPKSDGTRYLLFAFSDTDSKGKKNLRDQTRNTILMQNRMGCFFKVQMNGKTNLFKGTILDGELIQVKPKYEDERMITPARTEFQIFDCIACFGDLMVDKTYSERIVAAKKASDSINFDSRDPFFPVVKTIIPPMYLEQLLQNPFVNYDIDGVILVPVNSPYRSGKDIDLFKYKLMHTVDFLVLRGYQRDVLRLFVIDNESKTKVDELILSKIQLDELGIADSNLLHGAIVECTWSGNRWNPVKIRLDKKVPNNRTTFELTLRNIEENIQPKEITAILEKRLDGDY